MSITQTAIRLPHLGALAFCLACLCLAIVCSLGWLSAHREADLLRTELQLATSEVRAARQQIEAEQIIGRRQIEMLRERQTSAPATSP
ncbi:MAG: hypothetical protein WC378_01645 [Opitutaceae bacterium]|jgi:hypothetical protein